MNANIQRLLKKNRLLNPTKPNPTKPNPTKPNPTKTELSIKQTNNNNNNIKNNLLINRIFIKSEICKQNIKNRLEINLTDTHIPNIIHLCYRTKNIPNYIIPNWKKLNQEYEIKLYDNNDCINFLLNNFEQKYVDIFNFIQNGPIKADFFRVCVLYIEGGVYSDIDCEPLISIKDFLAQDVTFLTCASMKKNDLNPHFIISPPKHQILQYCINKYIEFYDTKKEYSYWGWSIIFIMNDIFFKIFKSYINDDCIIYDKNNNKYQIIKEIYPNNTNNLGDRYDIYCEYNKKKILNNRYVGYDCINHHFR